MGPVRRSRVRLSSQGNLRRQQHPAEYSCRFRHQTPEAERKNRSVRGAPCRSRVDPIFTVRPLRRTAIRTEQGTPMNKVSTILRQAQVSILRQAQVSRPAIAALSGLAVPLVLAAPLALAAPGDLDPSFGDVGRINPLLDLSEFPIWSLEARDDGFILGGGGDNCGYYCSYYNYYSYDYYTSGFTGLMDSDGAAELVSDDAQRHPGPGRRSSGRRRESDWCWSIARGRPVEAGGLSPERGRFPGFHVWRRGGRAVPSARCGLLREQRCTRSGHRRRRGRRNSRQQHRDRRAAARRRQRGHGLRQLGGLHPAASYSQPALPRGSERASAHRANGRWQLPGLGEPR